MQSKTAYDQMYRQLYRLFEDVTPLKQDCGVLCGGACCKGDEKTGMLLFPHEPTSLRVYAADGRRFAVCGGVCVRKDRPLSCRIFPFFPAVDETGSVRVIVDPRGEALCPLVRQAEHVRFSRKFLRRMKKAGKILARDEACRVFLREVTAEIEDASAMQERLQERK